MQKIILSRTDNLGDVVLSLPVAGKLKKLFPEIKIIFIGKKYTQAIIEACIFIDEFWDKDQLESYPTHAIGAILFLFPDKEVARWSKKHKIPLRIGTSHRWWHWLYLNKLVNFSRRKSDLHESQLNFKLLQPLGFNELVPLAEIPDLYGLQAKPENIPDWLKQSLSLTKQKIILHPKSKGSAREWALIKYYELAESLPEADFQVFVSGSAAEYEMINYELPQLFDLPQVQNLAGKLTLSEFINFIANANVLVAASTGPLHIAAALGIKTIGIFPNIKPVHPGRWQAIGSSVSILTWDKPNCEDCRKNPAACACMQAITPKSVQQQII
ncbi:MAG: glycosyltransferase family 9 protein [Verrucomicrobia bacterium]|nr:glycosyltransferase family 9 protein [Cytophagales bacterium]